MGALSPQSFYITTPIYYVNAVPHVGTAYTMVVADALARWNRLAGRETFFLTGTDEHGLKIAQSAAEHNMTPKEWVDAMSERFKDAWTELGMSYDRFIRTTEVAHYETVQRFLKKIYENGFIYKSLYSGLYCVACEAYYSESELLEGDKCPTHLRAVEKMSEENYFFRLSAFEEPLRRWYEDNPSAVVPSSRRNEALGFINQGLEDISITRTSIDWGVPAPWDPDHVFYVWYDALINYLTGIDYGMDEERFERLWGNVHHVLGKDILRFHCVWWPAMCMAAGIDPPKQFIVHGWLLAGGAKISKSNTKVSVDPIAIARDFGVDTMRYYMLKETHIGSDGDFSLEGMVATYNSDIANNFGNLLQRSLALVISKLDGVTPGAPVDAPEVFCFDERVEKAVEAWESFEPYAALESVMDLLRSANVYLEQEEPWKSSSTEKIEVVLGSVLELIRTAALLLLPATPESSMKVLSRLGADMSSDLRSDLKFGRYEGGKAIKKEAPLFPRLELG
ncbi:methionyl-tRNA synthetase [Ferrithrix thermotolerans DSM 19514]|uniref:Methionine--tRNA ligase n=1 Tax=Ferrithrix thermotolerans DSM 19514 TaxID=1121881 RepID=A0A1M4Y1L6_9ACTN|nr:methionine--tRNA ligase [Ferrithrix thermotolerans]SHE99558.1 methionyl-tRNA synthetase [Ferrithrix thermotolerans DSM 19514]